MEQAIEDLLLQLDSESLNIFPCFYDRPNEIQFRIGLNDGPQIKFEMEYDKTLFIRDEKEKSINYIVSDEQFEKCQNICYRIRSLCKKEEYRNIRDNNLQIMLSTLVAAIKPVIAKKLKIS